MDGSEPFLCYIKMSDILNKSHRVAGRRMKRTYGRVQRVKREPKSVIVGYVCIYTLYTVLISAINFTF